MSYRPENVDGPLYGVYWGGHDYDFTDRPEVFEDLLDAQTRFTERYRLGGWEKQLFVFVDGEREDIALPLVESECTLYLYEDAECEGDALIMLYYDADDFMRVKYFGDE